MKYDGEILTKYDGEMYTSPPSCSKIGYLVGPENAIDF